MKYEDSTTTFSKINKTPQYFKFNKFSHQDRFLIANILDDMHIKILYIYKFYVIIL